MIEPDVTERIRTIFLHQRPDVSIAEAAALLGWTDRETTEAIHAGEVEADETAGDVRIGREELFAKALETWPLEQIEEALGPDVDHVLPPALRLTDLHARVPRYHIAMLHHLAARNHTTVNAVLARELDALASANAEDLSSSLPEFEAAMNWPAAGMITP